MKLFRLLLLLTLTATLFTGCDDEEPIPVRPDRDDAFLRVVNASDTYAEVDFFTDYLSEESPLALGLGFAEAWPPASYLTIEAINPAEFTGDSIPVREIMARLLTVTGAGGTSSVPLVYENIDGIDEEDPFELELPAGDRSTVYLYDSLNLQRYYRTLDPAINYTGVDELNSQVRFVNLSAVDTVEFFSIDTLDTVYTDTTFLMPLTHEEQYSEFYAADTAQPNMAIARRFGVRRPDGALLETVTIEVVPQRSFVIVYTQSGAFHYRVRASE